MPRLEDKLSASMTQADGKGEQKSRKSAAKARPEKADGGKAASKGKAARKSTDATRSRTQGGGSKAAKGAAGGNQAGRLSARQVWPD